MERLAGTNLPPKFEEIIKKHQQQAPVKVGSLAQDLGLSVLISDLPTGISGKLSREKQGDGQWTIRVNRHEHKNRQRFTIAHEIAHFLLHKDQIKNSLSAELTDDTFYRSGLPERREWEANKLAAEILMPWSLIRSLTEAGKKTPSELANSLEVSEAAVSIRLGLPT